MADSESWVVFTERTPVILPDGPVRSLSSLHVKGVGVDKDGKQREGYGNILNFGNTIFCAENEGLELQITLRKFRRDPQNNG